MRELKLSIVVLLLISAVIMTICAPNVKAVDFKLSWTERASIPTPRAQVATIVGDDGKIYVMGGYNQTVALNVTEVYNPSTNTWETRAPMLEGVRGAAAAKGLNGLIYVFGGANETSPKTPAVQAYNTTSNTWTKKANIPFAVWMAGAVTGDDGRVYIVGGEEEGGVEGKRLQIYDPTGDNWTAGPSMSVARSELSAAKDRNGFIYAMGGYSGSLALNTVEVYDPHSMTWSSRKPMPDGRLEFGTTLGADGNIYIVGGGTSYLNNEAPFFGAVMVYDPLGDTWSFEASMPTPRKELTAVAFGKSIYALGGSNGTALGIVEQATIAFPNTAPTAYIDSISPNPASNGSAISFTGHGVDTDGSVIGYKWRSSINGTISTATSFSISTLAVGTHTIYFSVQDNSGAWSQETSATATINQPVTEDPLYQTMLELQDMLNNLQQQNTNLTDKVNSLANKLDMTTWELLGASVVIIILVVVIIAVVFIPPKRKPTTT
jgi:N-acetylneuraminic acid mutarotase